MKVGQKVKTHRNEIGVIVKECTRPEWDWWVEIHFHAKGQDRKCKEPYKDEELTPYEDKSDSADK